MFMSEVQSYFAKYVQLCNMTIIIIILTQFIK